MPTTSAQKKERPPVIAVMGHIDHGKSTLLDYIRKTNTTLKEAGGITQHIAAYEVTHTTKEGAEKKITFLDTPGHAAFSGIRNRGANVADIAILVVSAEDGVKPQTLEALKSIKTADIPYVVAISKIDKPEANIERTKQSLAEKEIYIEGYGGDVPAVAISAKTGVGISELLDLILLVADLKELQGDEHAMPQGVIIESSVDPKKGLGATLIVKDGVLKKGTFVVSGASYTPVRMMENFLGKAVNEASFGSPVKIIGWNSLPQVGNPFSVVESKKEAEVIVTEFALAKKTATQKTASKQKTETQSTEEGAEETETVVIPLIIEADTAGSLEAILQEIARIEVPRVKVKIISHAIGRVTESDIKLASNDKRSIVINFNTKIEPGALAIALRLNIEIHEFNIIYKLTEWLEQALKDLAPTVSVEEVVAVAKIQKCFSINKDKQIVGGKVLSGSLPLGALVKILRRGVEIGQGKIRELQQQKAKVSSIDSPREFGTCVEAKIEIAPGDELHAFITVEKK